MQKTKFFDNITKRFETIQETLLIELMTTRNGEHHRLIEINNLVARALKITKENEIHKQEQLPGVCN